MRVRPRQFVRQLYKHWEIIEHLSRLSRELAVFEVSQVLKLVAQYSAAEADAAQILRELHEADILQLSGRSDNLQLNPLLIEFIRGLTHEHELGLSAVLKARIDAIHNASTQIAQAINKQDMDLLRLSAVQLSELLRQIDQQLQQDRSAILDIAEKAKASHVSMPISQRYQAVLNAYDEYVEPINEMMDSGLSGTFYPHLTDAITALDQAEDYLSVRGALYTQRLQLRHVSQQAKELRYRGRIIAKECADILLPLRAELRQHNDLSTAVSELLSQVRKRGLKRAMPHCVISPLPTWHRKRYDRLQLGGEIREFMAIAQQFEPQTQAFPEGLPSKKMPVEPWIDEKQLEEQLCQALPIPDLLIWLKNNCPGALDTSCLRLYHEFVRNPKWQARLQQAPVSTDLQQIRVSYYPHQLKALSEPSVSHDQ